MRIFYPLLLLVIITASSCSTQRYMNNPGAANVPLLLKKGDSKISGNYSSNLNFLLVEPDNANSSNDDKNRSNGYDVQAAVAVTDHFAVQANYFYRAEKNDYRQYNADEYFVHYKRHLLEGGIGYFTGFNNNKIMLQFFGGAGGGKFSFTDKLFDTSNVPVPKFHETKVFKYYFQPAIIFRPRENFALAIATRLSVMKYSNVRTSYTDNELYSYDLNDITSQPFVFWEPSFTNIIGFKKVPALKLQYQAIVSTKLSDKFLNYRVFNFSVGAMIDIGKAFSKSE